MGRDDVKDDTRAAPRCACHHPRCLLLQLRPLPPASGRQRRDRREGLGFPTPFCQGFALSLPCSENECKNFGTISGGLTNHAPLTRTQSLASPALASRAARPAHAASARSLARALRSTAAASLHTVTYRSFSSPIVACLSLLIVTSRCMPHTSNSNDCLFDITCQPTPASERPPAHPPS